MWKRKLGVFELLVAALVFELFLGTRTRALVLLVMVIVAWAAKAKFKGEFSLQEAWSVVLGGFGQIEKFGD